MDRARVSAWLRRLHRWLGLTAAAFVVLLAVTGLLLIPADTLSLDHHRLRADWSVRLYGLEPPALVDAREAGAHWISLWGSRLFLDDAPIDRVGASTLVAAFGGNDHDDDAFLTVVTDRQLLLLTPSGELIDVLAAPTSRPLVAATRRLDGPPGPRTEIRSDDGQRWSTDADATGWHAEPPASAGPSAITAPGGPATQGRAGEDLPEALQQRIRQWWRGEGISALQFVRDLHSGMLGRKTGRRLMDLAALALLFLALSGVWMALRRGRNGRKAGTGRRRRPASTTHTRP